jgi:hypothetical protein
LKTGLLSALPAAILALLFAAPLHSRGDIENEVLEELNYMRSKPSVYAEELDDFERRFDGRLVMGDGDEPDVMSNEGVRAVTEAAREMRRVRPLPLITHSDLLARAAADHVRAQGASGQTGHISNRKGPGDRVKARGGGPYVGEVIAYGVWSGRNAIRQFIVDDGVAGRGHRKLLLSPTYRYAGVACGSHREWRNMCVIVLSETPDGGPVKPRPN